MTIGFEEILEVLWACEGSFHCGNEPKGLRRRSSCFDMETYWGVTAGALTDVWPGEVLSAGKRKQGIFCVCGMPSCTYHSCFRLPEQSSLECSSISRDASNTSRWRQ